MASELLTKQRELILATLALHNSFNTIANISLDERNCFIFNQQLLLSIVQSLTPDHHPQPEPPALPRKLATHSNKVKQRTLPVSTCTPSTASVSFRADGRQAVTAVASPVVADELLIGPMGTRPGANLRDDDEEEDEDDVSEDGDELDWDKEEEEALDDFDRLLAKRLSG